MKSITIISGGQTGADRGALDAAFELGLPHGGWCPKGRKCETGVIPERYRLQETASPDYAARTEQNVIDSDGTLVLYWREMAGGTRLTAEFARRHQRPLIEIDLAELDADQARKAQAVADVAAWLMENRIARLHVAGPRESSQPGIAERTRAFIRKAIGHGR